MFGLIPKEQKFFAMFHAMTKNIVKGAEILKIMLDDFDEPLVRQHEIKEIEHSVDLQTHAIIETLNKSFITPFDREDIYALASALDDIIDVIDASAQHIVVYHIAEITAEAKELGFLILKACQMIDKAVAALENTKTKNIAEYFVEINTLENEADRVRSAAISKLFDTEKDPICLIKWKEIYEELELITDKCEDAANILESVVVKDA